MAQCIEKLCDVSTVVSTLCIAPFLAKIFPIRLFCNVIIAYCFVCQTEASIPAVDFARSLAAIQRIVERNSQVSLC